LVKKLSNLVGRNVNKTNCGKKSSSLAAAVQMHISLLYSHVDVRIN